MITVRQLSKKYGSLQAVYPLDMEVRPGELFGLIGPDGAGKTSLIRMLTTLLLPDGGHASVAGLNIVTDYRLLRTRIGYMPGRFSLYQDLTVEENLSFFAGIFGTSIQENYELIRDIYVQIEPFKNRKAGALSGGMKQKLALCCALIHKPDVLFLDEPTTGVDPVSRKEFWDMLDRLSAAGITILVTTPYMDEAQRCHRIALMQQGRILATDTPAGIVEAYSRKLLAVRAEKPYQLILDLRSFVPDALCYAFGSWVHLALPESATIGAGEVYRHLETTGHHNIEVQEAVPNVEDCFIAFTHSTQPAL